MGRGRGPGRRRAHGCAAVPLGRPRVLSASGSSGRCEASALAASLRRWLSCWTCRARRSPGKRCSPSTRLPSSRLLPVSYNSACSLLTTPAAASLFTPGAGAGAGFAPSRVAASVCGIQVESLRPRRGSRPRSDGDREGRAVPAPLSLLWRRLGPPRGRRGGLGAGLGPPSRDVCLCETPGSGLFSWTWQKHTRHKEPL